VIIDNELRADYNTIAYSSITTISNIRIVNIKVTILLIFLIGYFTNISLIIKIISN
jgi:hypothetical protein